MPEPHPLIKWLRNEPEPPAPSPAESSHEEKQAALMAWIRGESAPVHSGKDARVPEKFQTFEPPQVRPGRTFARAAVEGALDAAALPVVAASKAADYVTGRDSSMSHLSGKDAAESLEYLTSGADPAEIRREEAFAEGEIPQAQTAGKFVGEYAGGAPLAALTGRVPTAGAILNVAKGEKGGKRKGGFETFYRVHKASEPGDTVMNPRRPDGWTADYESISSQPEGTSAALSLSELKAYAQQHGLTPGPGDRVIRMRGDYGDSDADEGAVRAIPEGWEDVGDAGRLLSWPKEKSDRADRTLSFLGRNGVRIPTATVKSNQSWPTPKPGELKINPSGMREESLKFLREGGKPVETLPVTITYYADNPGVPVVSDGRHRITVARERGEKDVIGTIRYIGKRGGVQHEVKGVKIPIGEAE